MLFAFDACTTETCVNNLIVNRVSLGKVVSVGELQ